MRKIKEVLRLKSEGFLSDRQIARSCSIARSTVCDYLERACRAGLKWPLPEQLDDAALEQMLYPPACCMPPSKRELPSFEDIHRELKRKGVTLQLLWYEYKQAHPAGLQYSQFCHRYRQWAQRLDVSLRQTYRAGEKLFVDYAGQTMKLTDPITGQTRDVYLFITTLGASSYTYVEACLAQDLPSWISSHVRTFQFFGRPRDHRSGQSQGRGQQSLLLRAGYQSNLSRHGPALRHGGYPRPGGQAEGQGQGGVGRVDRRALDYSRPS